jgi:hypothetical protein
MAEANVHRDTADPLEISHELSDLRPGYVGLFAIGLAVTLGLVLVLTVLLMHYKTALHEERETPLPRLAREREAMPQPRLQIEAHRELREMRAGEETVLNSYGWVDRDAGIVRIPVERAMAILAEEGLPARPDAAAERAESTRGKIDGAAQ